MGLYDVTLNRCVVCLGCSIDNHKPERQRGFGTLCCLIKVSVLAFEFRQICGYLRFIKKMGLSVDITLDPLVGNNIST